MHFLIALSFLAVIILRALPNSETLGEVTITYGYGILPNLVPFSFIVLGMVAIAIGVTWLSFTWNLPGQKQVRRKDLNLRRSLTALLIWLLVAFAAQLAGRRIFLLNGTLDYFLLILTGFFIYRLAVKWLVKIFQPGFLALDDGTLYLRTLFGRSKRYLKNLKMVRFDSRREASCLNLKMGPTIFS